MSKSSKPCGYCGHMRIMNQENISKTSYESDRNKIQISQEKPESNHLKQIVMPECRCSDHDDKKD